ncbi:Acyltransferase family protein [Roseimaritima multifibrata]|uniref:Acyltransferase family protein n=1 Tax=Roseimaritima multifibrata TaxID=1930274 RepID=A0A517MAS8_9BACT|nr:acyltransferase [Roseimaritima multifibrata]QDS91985.1 Acyltransferase family protein [Roseimaritima multifibrata]
MPAPAVPHRRIVELDALRAMAAINLVLFHFTHVYAVKFGYSSPLGFEWPYGAYGVELFFILSGFVNAMSLLRRGQPTNFLLARFIRIAPIFWIAIGVNACIAGMAPLSEFPVSGSQWLANLTLMPKIFGFDCVDPVMWTLQIEMLFYGILTVLYVSGALKRPVLTWAAMVTASLLVCPLHDSWIAAGESGMHVQFAGIVRRIMLLDFIPLFGIGFLLYMIKIGKGPMWRNLCGILLAAAVFHSIDHGKHNPLATALIIGLVTLSAYGKIPLLRFRIFVWISAISYPLYLFHNNLGTVLIHRFDQAGVAPVVAMCIALVFSIALAILVTTRIEQPLTRYLRNRFLEGRIAAAKRASANS